LRNYLNVVQSPKSKAQCQKPVLDFEHRTLDFGLWTLDFGLLYSATFTDHLANPRNVGELPDASAVAEESNPVCGDRLRLSLRVRDGRIEAARFLAYGCAPTLACGSVLAEMIEGMTIEDAARLTRQEITRVLGGLPARKQHAAALSIETLRAALEARARATHSAPEGRDISSP
jgi:nitrogen fixation NifU-like protein